MGHHRISHAGKVNPGEADASSGPVNRNIVVAGHRTSIRLEPVMWDALKEICRRERINLHEIATQIARNRSPATSLTAAIRIFIMAYYRAAATDDGHRRAGHGMETMPRDVAAMSGVFCLPSAQAAIKK